MARAYTADLRERVPLACERGGLSRAGVAALSGVGESTLARRRQTSRTGGAGGRSRTPAAPRRGWAGRPRTSPRSRWRSATIARWPSTRPGPPSGPGWRWAARPCAGRPESSARAAKKTLRAAERDRPELVEARAAWRAGLARIEPRRPVSLDEGGVGTRTARPCARAAGGGRAVGKVPCGHRRRLTVLGALALAGVVAAM